MASIVMELGKQSTGDMLASLGSCTPPGTPPIPESLTERDEPVGEWKRMRGNAKTSKGLVSAAVVIEESYIFQH